MTSAIQNQAQVTSNQQVTPSSTGSMFDSLDVRTQPVATMATTATTTAVVTTPPNTLSSSGGGVFGDLVDLFGSNNNTAGSLTSHTPQTNPQHVC